MKNEFGRNTWGRKGVVPLTQISAKHCLIPEPFTLNPSPEPTDLIKKIMLEYSDDFASFLRHAEN